MTDTYNKVRKHTTLEQQDYLFDFAQAESQADRNWYSEIDSVETLADAVQFLTDNKYQIERLLIDEFGWGYA